MNMKKRFLEKRRINELLGDKDLSEVKLNYTLSKIEKINELKSSSRSSFNKDSNKKRLKFDEEREIKEKKANKEKRRKMGRIKFNLDNDENSTMRNELKKFMNLNCYTEIKNDSIHLSEGYRNRTRHNYTKKIDFFKTFLLVFILSIIKTESSINISKFNFIHNKGNLEYINLIKNKIKNLTSAVNIHDKLLFIISIVIMIVIVIIIIINIEKSQEERIIEELSYNKDKNCRSKNFDSIRKTIGKEKIKKSFLKINKSKINIKSNHYHEKKFYFLLIIIIIMIFPVLQKSSNYYIFQSNDYIIKLKIKGPGPKQVYHTNSPNIVRINNAVKSSSNTQNDLQEGENIVELIWYNKVNNCQEMFYGCRDILEIDFSNFDSSEVTDMYEMFYDCKSLTSINFANFDTSRVTRLCHMFYNCESLISLDLSRFVTSQAQHMENMFYGCKNLLYINFKNGNTNSASSSCGGMFGQTPKNLVVCLETSDTKIIEQINSDSCRKMDCYNDWKQIQNKINNNNGNCVQSCMSVNLYEYQSRCHDDCPPKTYNNSFICEDCHSDCEICEAKYTLSSSNCKKCRDSDKFLAYGNCISFCTKGFYKDELDESIKLCECELEQCLECAKESKINNLCISCNEGYYPIYDPFYNGNPYYNCSNEKIGYYLTNIDGKQFLHPCYPSCKSCDIKGNETYHNCIECKNDSLYFELNMNHNKNCYEKCPYYNYINRTTQKAYCTENPECPSYFNKFIPDKDECINDCREYSDYKYEFRNKCYKNDCPINSTRPDNETNGIYYCKPVCPEDKPFEVIKTQECVKYCNIQDMKKNLCVLNNIKEEESDNNGKDKDTKIQDMILQSVESSFTSEDYNTSTLDNGEDDVIENDKMTITLTTTENQKSNSNKNKTTIDLGECETLLRKAYNLSDEQTIYMKKVDVKQEGMKIPKIEYDVYCKLFGNNLIKLNLTVCEKTKIDLSIPFTITENLDKYNTSSGYYNDICYTASSDSGTDITLQDRKKDFMENDKTVCQDDCDFTEYDHETNKAKCSCKVQKSTPTSIADMKINKTKIFEGFLNIKDIMNFKLLICYKVLFTKKGILKNIGSFIIIPIIIFHLICIIIFYCKSFKSIKKIIHKIIYVMKNFDLVKDSKRTKKDGKEMKKINKYNKETINNKGDDINERKKESKINILNSDNEASKKNLKKIKHSPVKRKEKISIPIENENNIIIENKNKKKKNNNIRNINTEKGNKKGDKIYNIIKLVKLKNIMDYNDEELNDLKYDLAIKYDKRTYCQYYYSLLKTKHIIFFSFFNNNDYNSQIIKIDLFLISFSIEFAVNTLFFNDSTMHKILEDEGSFNFIYQFPQIIYSSLISMALNAFISLLALSESEIIALKQLKKNIINKELRKKEKILKKRIRIKFIIFFILGFLLLLFLWYYVSTFCSIYVNTQIHLIKDTLISFGISLIYPFPIYLIPGIFRIIALSDKKNKRIFLYNFSKIFQIF